MTDRFADLQRWRARRANCLTAGGLLAALALFGCSSSSTPSTAPTSSTSASASPTSTPSPSATAKPSTISTTLPGSLNTQELQAAENAITAVKAYEDVATQVTYSGGAHPERFEKISTQTALEDGRALAAYYQEKGWRAEGNVAFVWIDVIKVSMQTDPATHTVPEVKIDACIDASQTSVIDATGKYVTKAPQKRIYIDHYLVRYYPKDPHGGINGWFVGNTRNKQVDSCDR